jgi:hypothetical protein
MTDRDLGFIAVGLAISIIYGTIANVRIDQLTQRMNEHGEKLEMLMQVKQNKPGNSAAISAIHGGEQVCRVTGGSRIESEFCKVCSDDDGRWEPVDGVCAARR